MLASIPGLAINSLQKISLNECVWSTVPAIIIVEKIKNYLLETVITTVITRQYTVQMVFTNRELPIRRCYDPTIIMAGTVVPQESNMSWEQWIKHQGLNLQVMLHHSPRQISTFDLAPPITLGVMCNTDK